MNKMTCHELTGYLHFQMWKLKVGGNYREEVGFESQNCFELTSNFTSVWLFKLKCLFPLVNGWLLDLAVYHSCWPCHEWSLVINGCLRWEPRTSVDWKYKAYSKGILKNRLPYLYRPSFCTKANYHHIFWYIKVQYEAHPWPHLPQNWSFGMTCHMARLLGIMYIQEDRVSLMQGWGHLRNKERITVTQPDEAHAFAE